MSVFKVKYYQDNDINLVYSVKTEEKQNIFGKETITKFLIYLNDNWGWVDAEDYTPVEN